ncbi:MAG TPA: hypothetical protein VER33_16905 [Polyangiaceae bacterium]|nr:hypothetical protein [Polyangiaceae bacterium]
MKSGREANARDQGTSPFGSILTRLCEGSGAIAAALVDAEGETVDYAGRANPFELRVAAAEWRLVLAVLEGQRAAQGSVTHELVVRGAQQSFAVSALSEGYALILVLGRHAFRTSRRALSQAAEELQREAGLSGLAPPDRWRWQRVAVRSPAEDDRRPEAVWYDGAWRFVTILGRVQGRDLGPQEVGYMARFMAGPEMILVREPLGKWFAGDLP